MESQASNFQGQKVALVTGTLAEPALRRVAQALAEVVWIKPHVIVLNIQVAALMNADWVLHKLSLPEDLAIDLVVLPGHCVGALEPVAKKLGVAVQRGPRDLHDLPTMFGQPKTAKEYGPYDIQILAEISAAPRMPLHTLLAEADELHHAGADMIDLGCEPSTERTAWPGLAEAVSALRQRGLRVSVDSFHPQEVRAACAVGAELVLSVDSSNRHVALDLGAEVVAIPDTPSDLDSLDRTIEYLDKHGVRFRVDPILEPIGFGFAASLGRYLEVRRRYAQVQMIMGIGNLTEMTEVDSAAVNALLVGFCQEMRIASVLTTQVINWARSSVREIDLARRLMYYAVTHKALPKQVDERMVMLRDAKVHSPDADEMRDLAGRLTDRNIRIFADVQRCQLHAMNKDVHAIGTDPFALFAELDVDNPSHAFYLGYEMAKAMTALTLAKKYVQDEPLNWGLLTRGEVSHHQDRGNAKSHRPHPRASKRQRPSR